MEAVAQQYGSQIDTLITNAANDHTTNEIILKLKTYKYEKCSFDACSQDESDFFSTHAEQINLFFSARQLLPIAIFADAIVW